MGVIESAVEWAIQIANDPSHGYSQANRWGPDYDCSSFVISAFEQAGVPLREAGASYTGNMRGAMINCGFVDVTVLVGLASGYGLQPGDVLLNYAAHTCLFIGAGKVANCRTDEGHPESGDQGQEIRIQSYWNFPWDCVLRYKGSHTGSNVSNPDTSPAPSPYNRAVLRKGMVGDDVRFLQEDLNRLGYDCGEADGQFGPKTFRAVILFQEEHGLQVDGVAGRKTKEAIQKALEELAGTDAPADPPADTPEAPTEDTGERFWLPDLKRGDIGPAVSLLQSALYIRGYDCGDIDGNFGPKTLAKLNKFHEDRDMELTGIADQNTWIKLLGVD